MKKLIMAWYFAILTSLFTGSLLASSAQAQHNTVWIDVRTEAEWNAGHLKGAILIPYNEIAQRIGEHVKNKRQPINLYCRSGRRAEIALQTLEKLGYINVQNRGALENLRRQGVTITQ